MPLGDSVAERDALFELTREAEEAERRSAEAQSSVALRVRMLESNMRLIEAYGSASTSTQRMVEGAVIERHRRRINILHSNVDDRGHPFDVDTDEETDEEIRRDLLEEGFIRIDAPVGQSQQRPWYARRDLDTPEVLRFVSPEPFIPTVAETSSDEETAEAEPELESEPRPMSTARREALIAQVQREVEQLQSNQSLEERARQETEIFPRLRMAGSPYDRPPAAAIVPQEGEQEPVWYYRRAREMALEDAERMQEPLPEPVPAPAPSDFTTPPLVPGRAEFARFSSLMDVVMAAQRRTYPHRPESEWARQSVRTDLKALLHAAQQRLDAEQERSAAGQTFPEGSYLELSDLLRDMFLCVDRI